MFISLEEKESHTTKCKPSTKLSIEIRIVFKGHHTSQLKETFKLPNNKNCIDLTTYVEYQAGECYIASVCRLSLCFGFSVSSQASKRSQGDVNMLTMQLESLWFCPTLGYILINFTSI